MPGFGFGFKASPNTLTKGVLIAPPGNRFVTETIGGVICYLTETIGGVTYYLTEAV